MFFNLIIFKNFLINFKSFSAAYLNYIKRTSAYIIKLLVYTKVLKKKINPISTYKGVYTQLRSSISTTLRF